MSDLNRASIFVPITRITKADGGRTRIVTGVAASDRLDYDGQRADYAWLKRELSSWFEVGNMRQDHRVGGVGKAMTLEFDDRAKTATVISKAIDSDTILKLDEKVLTGYSWGAKSVPGNPIRVQKDADGTEWVKSGKIVEVSYVDHPANPDCFVSLVKSAGKKGLQRSAILGDLAASDIPGGQDFDAILKAMLADIAKRDVSAAERERLGSQGHAVDTGQDHPSYPIKNEGDLKNAIKAYGRAAPGDRAKVRAHIISEAKRLGRTDLIPDTWKVAEAALAKANGCMCCDDCGPDCGGDCCGDCTMNPAKAATPAGILRGVRSLTEQESDPEYRAFLMKVVDGVEKWSKAEGAAISLPDFQTLAYLGKAAEVPELEKRRTFYTQSQRQAVEQAMQNLHQKLGLFMEGGASFDADQDQRTRTLTGQDAPPVSDQPGAGPNTPGDGVPGDGNLNFDPAMVRDGDPAVRTPDGQRDGRAQGEAGTHTWPPAGDAPGRGPGDQGKGEPPGGKGKQPFDGQQQAPDRSTPRGQQAPSKAAKAQKRLRKLKGEMTELRKGVSGGGVAGQPAIALQQSLSPTSKPKNGTKALRREVKRLGTDLRKALEAQARAPEAERDQVATAVTLVEKRFQKALNKMRKRLAATKAPRPDPLEARIAELQKAIAAQTAAKPESDNSNLLLMADLTRAAFDQARKDSTEQATWLGKRVKRAERRLRKAATAESARLSKLTEGVEALGRLPRPGGPQLVRPTDKQFPVNDTIERSASPDLLKRMHILKEMSESSDRQTADDAREALRTLMAEVRG